MRLVALPLPLLAGFAVLAAGPLLFLVDGVVGGTGLLTWGTRWGTPIVFGTGAAVCFAAASRVTGHTPWRWFGTACLLWTGSNLYFALVTAPDPLPLPSPADIGYALFPFVVCVGLVQVARYRLPRVPFDVLLDALIVALCAGTLAAVFVFSVVDVKTTSFGRVLASLVYPVEDVAVIGVVVGVAMLLSWRLDLSIILVATALVAITAADVIVATRVLSGDPVGGAWPNFGWTLGVAVIAITGWISVAQRPVLIEPGQSHVRVPAVAAALALAVLAGSALGHVSNVAATFAIATLALGCVRMHLSYPEARALADSHRLALADELTSLPNRRKLMRDLQAACDSDQGHLFALYDLDGFKHYNDTHGHSEGDRLLIALATALAATVEPEGTAYRLGGDEFCVLAPATTDGQQKVHAGSRALAADGPGWRVTATYGSVTVPTEVADVGEALRLADRRMYAEKERRPVAARQQARDVLLSALGEQHPGLHAHTQDVTALAGAVAAEFGMRPSEVDEVVRAAELHDVGKIAIPTEILDKPGPLDEREWEVMRQHTIIGERMLKAAPALRAIAPLVRSSHERWDGNGYPDGLRGDEIPLGARIVSVCDAYDAMVADRPYRAGVPSAEALAELERSAGTQFDPDVVEVFVRLVRTEAFAGART